MNDPTTTQTKALERPFNDAVAILTTFVQQEQELRSDNDKGYEHTAAEALLAIEVIQDTVRGALAIVQIAGKTLSEKDRRIRKLILENARLKTISDERRDRLAEVKSRTEFGDLKRTPGELADLIRSIYTLTARPLTLPSGQVAI